MSSKILATFRISPSDWEAFRNKASQENTTASALLLKFVQSYLGDDSTANEKISDSTRAYLEHYIDSNLAKQTAHLEQHIDKGIETQKDSLEQYIDNNLDKQKIYLEQYIDKCIENHLRRLGEIETTLNEVKPKLRSRLDTDSQENVLASIYANLDNNIDLTNSPSLETNTDEDRSIYIDNNLYKFIDYQREAQTSIPETTDIGEENMVKSLVSKLDNSIDDSIDNLRQSLDNTVDTNIDISLTDYSIDSNLDTETDSITSTESKTYSDAIAIILQMVLRDRIPQKDVIALLNKENYPTATGVGVWTAPKVSKEVSRLRRSKNSQKNVHR